RALEPQRGGRRDRTGTHRTYRSHRPDRTYESHGSVESRSAAGRDAGAGDARAGGLLADARRLVRVEAAAGLAVNCQEVVRGHQVTHGRSTVKRAVATLPIVVVQPGGQRLGAL